MKNEDYQNPKIDKPVKFEITDYDKAKKTSIYPQEPEETVIGGPAPDPEEPTQVPEIKQEPPEETPKQPSTKIPRALKDLESSLDGKQWECKENHGRRLRDKTTGVQDEAEYQDNWDNTIPVENTETPKED